MCSWRRRAMSRRAGNTNRQLLWVLTAWAVALLGCDPKVVPLPVPHDGLLTRSGAVVALGSTSRFNAPGMGDAGVDAGAAPSPASATCGSTSSIWSATRCGRPSSAPRLTSALSVWSSCRTDASLRWAGGCATPWVCRPRPAGWCCSTPTASCPGNGISSTPPALRPWAP